MWQTPEHNVMIVKNQKDIEVSFDSALAVPKEYELLCEVTNTEVSFPAQTKAAWMSAYIQPSLLMGKQGSPNRAAYALLPMDCCTRSPANTVFS
jgi:predicted house-cleaning NTP pyrophosphatase (Maf/HAM1 superfamily)